MGLEYGKIQNTLVNRHILIVEDDKLLAQRIADLFEPYTNRRPKIAHSIDQAIKIVAQGQETFDLAIIDIMLPKTMKGFKEIQELENRLIVVRHIIEKAGSPPFSEVVEEELAEARRKRSDALKRIEHLIKKDGGIELVEKWRTSGTNPTQHFPILYLAAVGNTAVIQRGFEAAAEHADWLVKPVPSELILDKCVHLIDQN